MSSEISNPVPIDDSQAQTKEPTSSEPTGTRSSFIAASVAEIGLSVLRQAGMTALASLRDQRTAVIGEKIPDATATASDVIVGGFMREAIVFQRVGFKSALNSAVREAAITAATGAVTKLTGVAVGAIERKLRGTPKQ